MASISSAYKKHGADWPEADIDPTRPQRLAQTLIDSLNRQIHPVVIPREAIRNKLMFFLWDNVFSATAKPLAELVLAQDAKAKPRAPSATSPPTIIWRA